MNRTIKPQDHRPVKLRKWTPGPRRNEPRAFPWAATVKFQAEKLNVPKNDDGEYSSPELTEWYVARYLSDNRPTTGIK